MRPTLEACLAMALSFFPTSIAPQYVLTGQQVYQAPAAASGVMNPMKYSGLRSGHSIKNGTKLRILPVGDSITVGFKSDWDGGDGNGYLERLRENLSGE